GSDTETGRATSCRHAALFSATAPIVLPGSQAAHTASTTIVLQPSVRQAGRLQPGRKMFPNFESGHRGLPVRTGVRAVKLKEEEENLMKLRLRATMGLAVSAVSLSMMYGAAWPQDEPAWAVGRPKTEAAMKMAPVQPFPVPTAADKLPKLKVPQGFKV